MLDPGHDWSKEDYSAFPAIGHITLDIIEAKKLMDKDLIAKSDPYCDIKCGPRTEFKKLV